MNIKNAIDLIVSSENLYHEYVNKIAEKNRKNNKKYIESLTKLAYILFVMDKKDECFFIANTLSDINFDNNYEYWTWIELSIALKAFISRNSGDVNVFESSMGMLDNALNTGNELQKIVKRNVHNRFLSGEILDGKECPLDIEYEDIISEINLRLIYLMKLIKLSVFAEPSATYLGKLNDEIILNLDKIRSFISENSFYKLSPFK